MSSRSIIRDSSIANSLNELGVAKFELAETDFIDKLHDCFEALHPERNKTMNSGYYFSIYGGGKTYHQSIYDSFLPLLTDTLNGIFQKYKVLAIIAQVKGLGDNSKVGVHQDLTVVDESKYRSCTLWIPLMDSTLENGAISFLESSHLGLRNYRCHNIEYLFDNVENFIFDNSQPYPISKGQALLFDPATLHFSGSNVSQLPRISLAVSIVDEKAPEEILYYDKKKPFDGSATRYSVPTNFWQQYEDFEAERSQPPAFGTLIGTTQGVRILPYSKNQFLNNYWAGCAKATKQRISRITPSIMKDSNLQAELLEKGIVVMDFLSEQQVEKLQQTFNSLNDSRTDIPYDKLYTCLHNSDSEYRERMNKEIETIISPLIDARFKQVKNTVYTFQIKGIGDDSELYPHQDWNFTQEDLGMRTYTFWISLVDSDESNGTIAVLPESHLRLKNVRGAKIEPIFSGNQSRTIPFLEPLTIKAGQLVLFDSALLHYSSANNSSNIRVSVMTNILPEKAKSRLYFGSEKNLGMADEYEVPDDFFLRYQNFAEEFENPPSFSTLIRSVKINAEIAKQPFEELFPELEMTPCTKSLLRKD
ncbi:phytanoyl-CoA dioxygenase family protein [Flavobacteriales bacterium]|nr:phytanoyl-CoA dioxygenase family protein [Flavobacteriales bacterium]